MISTTDFVSPKSDLISIFIAGLITYRWSRPEMQHVLFYYRSVWHDTRTQGSCLARFRETQTMTTDHLHDIPDTVEVHGEKSEGGKLSIFLGILKRYSNSHRLGMCWNDRFIGVKDISAVRLSLPAQLVEPVGNLEYCEVSGWYWC